MAVFAAMVDRIDQNIGRLVAFLEERGQLEHTLILLCSDNGGCPFERSKNVDIPPWRAGSYYLYDASWATVSNTPLRHYKQNQYEGGIASPLIAHWPDRVRNPGSWAREPSHLIDIMATCLEVAGVSYPSTFGSETIEPLQGLSLLPLFEETGRAGHPWLYFQFGSDRAIRKGDWKLVSFRGHAWELYNLAEDRCEQRDLATVFPDKVSELSKLWRRVARDIDKAPRKVYAPVKNQPSPNHNGAWHKTDEHEGWTMPVF
jgi:arylsulfatase